MSLWAFLIYITLLGLTQNRITIFHCEILGQNTFYFTFFNL